MDAVMTRRPGSMGGTAPPLRGRRGFTLSEILIATAILGVGLVMVVAVFPVAIEQNKESTADVLGTIICENALAQIKASWTHPLAGVSNTFDPAMVDAASVVIEGNYPVPMLGDGGNAANRGFLVLARQPDLTRNDYQFVIVSYLKSNPNNNVRAKTVIFGSPDPNYTQFSVNSNTNWLKMGSPVIDPGSGRYAMIAAVFGSGPVTVKLDRPLTGITSVIVVAETDPVNGAVPRNDVLLSPATRVMTARASLRP